MKNFLKEKNNLAVVLCALIFCCFNFLGCAGVKETCRGILGISTKELERLRKEARVQVFNLEYKKCRELTLDALDDIGAYIYTQDKSKNLISVYVSDTDTTPVGIFFKEIDPTHTQMEVSSPSTYAKDLIASKLFTGLLNPELLITEKKKRLLEKENANKGEQKY